MKITRLPNKVLDSVYDLDTLCKYLKIKKSDLLPFHEKTGDIHEKFLNACSVLTKVAQVYNEGVILDWKDMRIYKYLPYLYFSGGSCLVTFRYGYYCLDCPVGFYHKSEENAKEAYKNFKSYFEDYWGMKADR